MKGLKSPTKRSVSEVSALEVSSRNLDKKSFYFGLCGDGMRDDHRKKKKKSSCLLVVVEEWWSNSTSGSKTIADLTSEIPSKRRNELFVLIRLDLASFLNALLSRRLMRKMVMRLKKMPNVAQTTVMGPLRR